MKTRTAVPIEQRKFRFLNGDHEAVFDRDVTLAHTVFQFVIAVANYYDQTEMPTLPEDLVVGEKALVQVEIGHINGKYTLLRTK